MLQIVGDSAWEGYPHVTTSEQYYMTIIIEVIKLELGNLKNKMRLPNKLDLLIN